VKRLSLLLLLFWLANTMAETLPLLETKVAPRNPYVQAQASYTLRLFRESHLQQGDFLVPEMTDTIMEFAGEDEPLLVTRAGRELEMIERRYLLFPQRSGTIELLAPLFTGRQLFIQGPRSSLQVRPRRPEYSDEVWLPATGMRISQHLDSNHHAWRVGEQGKRVITLEAKGLTGAQLPALPLPILNGMDVRRMSVETGERIEQGEMIGSRTEAHLLTPRSSGEHQLPAIQIPWWNTQKDGAEAAVLESVATTVSPRSVTIGQKQFTGPQLKSDSSEPAGSPEAIGIQVWGSLLILTTLALLIRAYAPGLLLWLSHYRQRRSHLAALRKACCSGDPTGAKEALLKWAASFQIDSAPTTLPALAERLTDIDAISALLELDAFLYGQSTTYWNAEHARQRILKGLHPLQEDATREKRNVIPGLNP